MMKPKKMILVLMPILLLLLASVMTEEVGAGTNTFKWLDIYNDDEMLNGTVSLTIQGNYLYVSATTAYNFTIFNITDKNNLVLEGYLKFPDSKPRECSISDDGLWAFVSSDHPSNDGALTIVNLTDKTNPTQEGNITWGGLHVEGAYYVDSDDVCYVADYENDVLRSVNVANKANPVELDNIATGDKPHGVWANNTIACVVTYGGNELKVYNVETPSSMVLKDTISSGIGNPAQVTVLESLDLCFVSNLGGSFNIFDISDPTNIVLENQTATTQPVDCLPSANGTQLFMTQIAGAPNYLATINVYDITTPSSPVLSNTLTGTNYTFWGPQATGTAITGRYFYIGAWYSSTITAFKFGEEQFTGSGYSTDFGGEVNVGSAFYASSYSTDFGGGVTIEEDTIDIDVAPDTWDANNPSCGSSTTENFTFYQNGSATIDTKIGFNKTNYTFVSYATWLGNGHDQYCANFTTDTWGSETNIAPKVGGDPVTTLKTSVNGNSNFGFGIRIYMPKTVSIASLREDFKVMFNATKS